MNDWLEYEESDTGNKLCVLDKYGDIFYNIIEKGKNGLYVYLDGYWQNDIAESRLTDYIIETLEERKKIAIEEQATTIHQLKFVTNDTERNKLTIKLNKLKTIIRVTTGNNTNISNVYNLFIKDIQIAIPLNVFEDVRTERLFNCKNGVVDLSTLELLPHDPKYHFTYKCKYPFIKDATSNLWEKQLKETIGYYDQAHDYLQKAVGYTFTGLNNLECLFFIFGKTRSGKGLFVEIISDLLGEELASGLAFNKLAKTRVESSDQGHEIAVLHTKKLVTSNEPEVGQKMNAALIKTITGNDKVSVAFKYGQYFTFLPKFKIWITSNFPPSANIDDDAFWSRIRLIVFPNSFFGKEDFNRKELLRSEENMIGILNWCLTGAYLFLQENRLDTPKILIDELTKTIADQDLVTQWLMTNELFITTDENDIKVFSTLYNNFRQWCDEIGETSWNVKLFSQSIINKGCIPARKFIDGKQQRCLLGIK